MYKRTFSVLLPLIFVISSACVYFVFIYRIYINENVIGLLFETTAEEASGLIGWRFCLWIFISLLLSLFFTFVFNNMKDDPDKKFKKNTVIIFLVTLPLFVLFRGFMPHLFPEGFCRII